MNVTDISGGLKSDIFVTMHVEHLMIMIKIKCNCHLFVIGFLLYVHYTLVRCIDDPWSNIVLKVSNYFFSF